ncbi:TetR/AcrR family transcriptional regulator [Noviherbaspirillum galbum]|uniref:TetR/AcrR family transcriptional regulator n=1 Tax=Noviherbaspirillum galbum TaxID=2709383 RepID=A0A6B3SHE8_9BURK|nr:TetR/AcrR family transcriptional regulator [Noviherbaspirillum galbum]NEX60080.1 TetR/AcrR family transcriptional regulator [Noviherbaspirillum galbum]
MGRQLEFDRAEAVALAVEAFWFNGYQALPALELADAMGVAKSSLYNTFGSKKTLFLEALDHYAQAQRARVVRMTQKADIQSELRRLLLDVACDNSAGRGCLLVNTATELGIRDLDVQHHVKAGLNGMIQAFEEVIRAGQANGEIGPHIVPAERAFIFVAGISGLRVLAKSGFTGKQLQPIIENLLSGIGG